MTETTPAQTTPGRDLRERIAAVLAHHNSDGSPSLNCYDPTHQRDLGLADDILTVIQPELDRRGAEIERLNATIARVRKLCDLTIAVSCRAQAIDQARDTLAVLDQIDASTITCSRCNDNPVDRESGLCEPCDAEIAAIKQWAANHDPRKETT
jgi:hypothetical protein